ncbi:SDR family oxidoreductase [Cystobacter fuscus]|uniref:SDR family NAD(P)-dependent oxidoreductase n=1 Tax=Cystobacter fuscus TaxID=43 RepID=UPI002B2B3747|nr:SDR family oxidoreductase [Cystobacter fuscus]
MIEKKRGRVSGRSAIVFGGGVAGDGLGNGKAAAMLLAREGAWVAVADVVMDRAEDSCAAIRAEGGTAIPLLCDVSDPAAVAAAVAQTKQTFGGIDILVNNVGIGGPGAGLFAYEEADWDRVFAVNIRGVFTTARHVVPIMLEKGYGRIVNISSTAALRVTNGNPSYAYAASKAAVIQLTQSLALEFARLGIRANCVVPGMIDTPHASAAFRRRLPREEADRIIAARTRTSPTGSQGSPWDIAQSVLFLSEEAVGYVNGAALVVDGGFTLATPGW